jgi:hypothetical protein
MSKSDPERPFVSCFPPIHVFLETKGNETGNQFVSGQARYSLEGDALAKWKQEFTLHRKRGSQ